ELGIDGALLALFAKAIALGDGQRVRRTLATGIRAYLAVAVLMVAAGVGLAVAMEHLVSVDSAHAADLRIACSVAVVALLLVPLTPFRSLTEASQEGYWVNAATLGQSLVATGLALWFASCDWGITGQMSAQAIGSAMFFGLLAIRGLSRRGKS